MQKKPETVLLRSLPDLAHVRIVDSQRILAGLCLVGGALEVGDLFGRLYIASGRFMLADAAGGDGVAEAAYAATG